MSEDRAHFQWQSSSTAADAVICLGWVPIHLRILINDRGTNPDQLEWYDRASFALWQAGADDAVLTTGSTGVITLDTAAISAYAGGDTVTATDVTNRKYFDCQGNVLVAGTIAPAGFTVVAGNQTNSGYNHGLADRDNVK